MKKGQIIILALIVIVCSIFLFPIYWTALTSLKTSLEIFAYPPTFITTNPILSNYYVRLSSFAVISETAVGSVPWMIDSTVVAIMATLISTFLIGAPAAYSLVRYLRSVWLGRLVLFMIVIPEVVFMVPFYSIISRIGLLNTWWGLTLVYLSFCAPFSTWLLMGFFKDVPGAVEEAARIDGLSPYQTFYMISLRMIMPGIMTAMVLCFVNCWNEFLYALVLTYTAFPSGAQTIPLFISDFVVLERQFNWGGLAAVGIFAMLPTIVMGVLAQKYLARGLTMGAVKG